MRLINPDLLVSDIRSASNLILFKVTVHGASVGKTRDVFLSQ